MRRLYAAIFGLALAGAVQAQSSRSEAEFLVNACKPLVGLAPRDDLGTVQAVTCTAYLSGWLQGYNYGEYDGVLRSGVTVWKLITGEIGLRPQRFCLPETITIQQVATIVVRDGVAQPQRLRHDATDFVLVSLIRAFPCPDEDASLATANRFMEQFKHHTCLLLSPAKCEEFRRRFPPRK